MNKVFKELADMISKAQELGLGGFNYTIKGEKDRFVCAVEFCNGEFKAMQVRRLINVDAIKDKEGE